MKFTEEKVNIGNWCENTVQELADFIALKQPNEKSSIGILLCKGIDTSDN